MMACDQSEKALQLEADRSFRADQTENTIQISDNLKSPLTNKVTQDLGTPSSMESWGQPMLIRKAALEIKVDQLARAKQALDSLLKLNGAYIEQQEIADINVDPRANIRIKIPSQQFDAFIKTAQDVLGEVRGVTITAQDVGEEYNDLSMRLQTKRKVLNRYQAILGRAGTIKEVLEAEREIGNILEEIERVEGRMNYLSNKTAYSEIQLSIFEWKEHIQLESRYGFDDEIYKAFSGGWKGVKGFLLFVFRIWPLLIVFTLAYFVFRKYRAAKKETGVK